MSSTFYRECLQFLGLSEDEDYDPFDEGKSDDDYNNDSDIDNGWRERLEYIHVFSILISIHLSIFIYIIKERQ